MIPGEPLRAIDKSCSIIAIELFDFYGNSCNGIDWLAFNVVVNS